MVKKKQHLPGGENCTITYNVPGCLPVENQVMENVHIQHREKAKPHSYIRSPIALSLFIYKNNLFFVYNTKKFCRQSVRVCVCRHRRASIHAQSFPLCWLKWVRINYCNTNTYTKSKPDVCITPITSGLYTVLTVWSLPWHYHEGSLKPCYYMDFQTESILSRHWVRESEKTGTCFLNAPQRELALALSQGQGSHQGYGSRREVTWPPCWQLMFEVIGCQAFSRWTNTSLYILSNMRQLLGSRCCHHLAQGWR